MMDYNYHEESTNSSEEVADDQDQENKVDLGVGRSYECVFCKRGFNTAQALGGHMNIHRKDRARNKPNKEITAQRLYHPSSNLLGLRHFSPPQDHHHHPHLTYTTYFPPAASSNSTLYERNHDSDRGHHQPSEPVIPGDWRMRLSLEFAPSIVDKNHDEELDLELRLGYD